MAIITPKDLMERLNKLEKAYPKLIKEGFSPTELKHLNQDNLIHGKTSEGGDMPPYSRKYRIGNVYYRDYKMRSNSFNRGRWDLKHWWGKKFDGLFYNSIKVKINLREIVFDTSYNPSYMKEIYYHVSKARILGITKKQWYEIQLENKKRVQEKALKIINEGQ
ncbi:hypothetical protein [Chryseobacterium mucoviscidosis]|uniref:hypothetical protein n=1 Tax=Chryseobacterium mucoviscidosis TaxID=1945581 RepID=UPI00301629B1